MSETIFDCPECGNELVACPSGRVCPNGHGKVYPKFKRWELNQARLRKLPHAHYHCSLHCWTIDGHRGVYKKCYGGPGSIQASDTYGVRLVRKSFIQHPDNEILERAFQQGGISQSCTGP